jgi:hypothetical protein
MLGLEPRHFNQITTDLRPAEHCKRVWLQYAWQGTDAVGREEVADAIARAEDDLTEALGYHPLPQWTAGEVVRTEPHYDPLLVGLSNLAQPFGMYRSVQARRGMVISGGIQASSLIAAAAAITWWDLDADGYDEFGAAVAPTTVTDENEIHVYFPGHGADPEWEIKPLRSVAFGGGNVTVAIDRHMLVDPDLWEALDPAEVDGDVDANFVASVSIYRVYNDPSQQGQLQWERSRNDCSCGDATCASCAWATQWACLQTRDPRLGIVTYQPATWDATTEAYAAAALAVGRQPERVRLWYRSGYTSSRVDRDYQQMDPAFERAIVLLSMCYLDRPVCSCANVEAFYQRWTEDLTLKGADGASYQLAEAVLSCPWGTRAGAVEAWRTIMRMRGDRAPVGEIARY